MSQKTQTYYWYRVTLQDVRGVACYKEGDIPGNNQLHCLQAVENMNKNSWKGVLMSVSLYKMDMESGMIDKEPEISWSRHGAGADRVKEMDWKAPYIEDDIPFAAPDKPDDKTSHCVSWMAHQLGTAKTGASSFISSDLQEL